MAASQVRLLALTDRLHDIELKSQQILAQKLALGTQKDALYNDYCDALEATNYMVAFSEAGGVTSYKDANFANMCMYDPNRTKNYAIIDVEGNVIVSKEEAEKYDMYADDKYAFAWAMMGLTVTNEDGSKIDGSEQGIGLDIPQTAGTESTYLTGIGKVGSGALSTFELQMIEIYNKNYGKDKTIDLTEYNNAVQSGNPKAIEDASNAIRRAHAEQINKAMVPEGLNGDGNDVLMSAAEMLAFMELGSEARAGLQVYIDDIRNAETNEKQQEAFDKFREALYKGGTNGLKTRDVYAKASTLQGGGNIEDGFSKEFSDHEFNFYVQRWEAITEAGGYAEVDPRYMYGAEGRESLENHLQAGLYTLQEFNDTTKEWQDTSVATSTSGNHLMEVQDKDGLKKAEAEYEHELDIIDRKESKMDNELAKLETERKAVTTEMDSLKTVRDDNIDRTFGIFG